MASIRKKKKNKFPNLQSIGSSLPSVTNHAPPPSFFNSSTENNASRPVGPRKKKGPRVQAIRFNGTDECKQFPWGSISRLTPRGQDVPTDLLADEEEGEYEEARKIEWVFMSDKEALHLKMDLPGVCKNGVKISIVDNFLIVKGEVKEKDKVIERKSYKGEFYLRPNLFKLDQLEAKMIKKGVLVVCLPKVEEEERKEYIYPVKVE